MPIYDIQCTNKECENVKEVIIKIRDLDLPLPPCEKCNSDTFRRVSGPKGFLMLGEGSYINGYKVFGKDGR